MQTATTSDVQTAPPPQDKPANGAGSPEHLAALPANTELLQQLEEQARKLASIQKLGREVAAKCNEISTQQTHVAEAESALKKERTSLHDLERQRDELQEELTILATGKQSERLPFKEPTEKAAKSDVPVSADDWKAVTLEMLGIKTKRVLTALHDHEPPIVTFGDLAAWQQKKGDFWAKDIKKLGDKGREEIENATSAYWLAHPQSNKPDPKMSPAERSDALLRAAFSDSSDESRQRWAALKDGATNDQIMAAIRESYDAHTFERGGDRCEFDSARMLVTIHFAGMKMSHQIGGMELAVALRRVLSIPQPFDDAAIDDSTIHEVVKNLGKRVILDIAVAQRKSGRWAAKYRLSIAGMKGDSGKLNTKDQFEGNYRNRAEATVWACDAIDTFVKNILNGKPTKKVRDAAKDIRKAMDKVDKTVAAEGPESAKTVAEGLPSPEAQGAHDAAVTEKDQTAKRARKQK